MKIGFYLQWNKGSLGSRGNVIGDELLAEGMCKALRRLECESCELYAPNYLPRFRLDVMVYLNDKAPKNDWANKHVLYLQNAFREGSDNVLSRMQKMGFDGYAFTSDRLLQLHQRSGLHGIWLPFGVDTDLFHPPSPGPQYAYDVAYVGNDIKGEMRTLLYICPALKFNFGLYGNWHLSWRSQLKFWRVRPYQRRFASIAKGKIPQENVPLLYAHSKINLNCTAQDSVDWDVITLRTFEILACKGFLISDRIPSAERELSDCVVFTGGGNDLEEKIRYYLTKPGERQRMAENGYRHVREKAQIVERMRLFLAYLKEIV